MRPRSSLVARERHWVIPSAGTAAAGPWCWAVQPAVAAAARSKARVREVMMRASLLGRPAAVHREVGAGDRRRLLAAEEQSERGDLLDRHELLGRLGGEEDIVHHLLA